MNPNYQIKKKNYIKVGKFFLGIQYKIVSFDHKKKLPKNQANNNFIWWRGFLIKLNSLIFGLKYFEENNFKYKINIFINKKKQKIFQAF